MTVNRVELLRQLNLIRVAVGNEEIPEIVPGLRNEIEKCPIAMSLANGWTVEVTETLIEFLWDRNTPPHPDVDAIVKRLRKLRFLNRVGEYGKYHFCFQPSATMYNFIQEFDNGDIEDLIRGNA